MMKTLSAVLMMSAVALSGCVVRSGPANATPVSGPVQTSGGSGSSAIVVANQSSNTICYIHISPSSDSNWGPDRLGATETVGPGASRGWSVDPGNWDIQLQDCQHNELLEQRDVTVAGAGIQLTYQ
ncbi:MAG: hypothetical protein IPK60_07975 [Sandaracinaceae bacterium]|nr:hypothetical protein [Sandaracinaceae bacterium]